MEIHIPKMVHGWRALAKEVGIIVIGVLIALGAEQAVQGVEWRHKTEAAEEAMRRELSKDDGPQVWGRYAMHRCIDDALDAIRAGAEKPVGRAEMVALIARHRTPFWTWDSLAFSAANASDVSLHLPSETMHRWTLAYAAIPALNQANVKEFNDGADLAALSRTGGPLSEAERGQILRAVEMLRRDNATIFVGVRVALPSIYKTGVRIDPTVRQAVMAAAERDYGKACLVAPPEPA
ncbi:hypothetical protein U1839_01550 [Sphingomonas sp. RT2P30]|uniref:hypothetical protein n=1 Tax=Parasphingomonas halimpatiens TaxID=3096162 RepID=UPI002FC9E8CB